MTYGATFDANPTLPRPTPRALFSRRARGASRSADSVEVMSLSEVRKIRQSLAGTATSQARTTPLLYVVAET